MDLNNISGIIKKINRLHDIINDLGTPSSTEKDLLKAYILDLYEAVVIAPESNNDLDVEQMRKKIRKQKKVEKKLKKQLQKNKDFLDDDTADEKNRAEVKVEKPQQEEVVAEENGNAPEEKAEAKPPIPEELLALFEIGGGSELSDKLSLKPIPDLTKAMGINEKIFTINELFGGDKNEFENIMKALNGLDNFDQARDVLIHSVASKHEWQKENKSKKAKSFIKLVHRRYN